MQEKATNVQVIEGIRPKVMKEVLRFIYTGEVDDIKAIGFELMVAADRFLLPRLKSLAVDSIIGNTFSGDAVKVAAIGSFFNSVDLVDYGVKEVLVNYTKMVHSPDWEDFVRTQPDLVVLITKKIAPKASDSDWDWSKYFLAPFLFF